MTERVAQVGAMDDWALAVGAQIAAVTEPLSITADGVLWVRVTTAAWMNELSLLAPDTAGPGSTRCRGAHR